MSLPLPMLSDLLSLQIDEQQQAEADAGESVDEVEGLGAKEGQQGRHLHQQQQLQHRGQLEHQGGQRLGHQVHPQDLQAAAATAQLQAVGTIAREALGCPFAAEPIRAAVQLRETAVWAQGVPGLCRGWSQEGACQQGANLNLETTDGRFPIHARPHQRL